MSKDTTAAALTVSEQLRIIASHLSEGHADVLHKAANSLESTPDVWRAYENVSKTNVEHRATIERMAERYNLLSKANDDACAMIKKMKSNEAYYTNWMTEKAAFLEMVRKPVGAYVFCPTADAVRDQTGNIWTRSK